MQVIRVRVKPNAKAQSVETSEDGSFVVHLKSPPVDGKANAELIQVLAKRFDVTKSKITIKSGASSKLKLIEIED